MLLLKLFVACALFVRGAFFYNFFLNIPTVEIVLKLIISSKFVLLGRVYSVLPSSNSTIEPKKSELSKGAAAYLYSDDSPTKEESKQSKHLKVN